MMSARPQEAIEGSTVHAPDALGLRLHGLVTETRIGHRGIAERTDRTNDDRVAEADVEASPCECVGVPRKLPSANGYTVHGSCPPRIMQCANDAYDNCV